MKRLFPNLIRNIDELEQDASQVLDKWMQVPDVTTVLKRHGMTSDFFATYFGSKVIAYAFSVLRGENELGNCPVIGVMLTLFKKKNIPISDIFLICVHFKNTMLTHILSRGLLTEELFNEVSYLIDHNFEGVLKEYVSMYYDDFYVPKSCTLDINNDKEPQAVLDENIPQKRTEVDHETKSVTSAKEYSEEIDIDMELLDELVELEDEAIAELELYEHFNEQARDNVITLFTQYSKVLNIMYEFQQLAFTLKILNDLLQKCDVDRLDEECNKAIGIYAKAIIDDLHVWRTTVFIDKSAEDIHYLDKTLLSSIAQLEIMLLPQDDAEDEIEFF